MLDSKKWVKKLVKKEQQHHIKETLKDPCEEIYGIDDLERNIGYLDSQKIRLKELRKKGLIN